MSVEISRAGDEYRIRLRAVRFRPEGEAPSGRDLSERLRVTTLADVPGM